MKPKDIEIGRKYLNSMHPGVVYLGVGRKILDHTGLPNGKISKFLVVIESGGEFNNFIVIHDKAGQVMWDAFRPFEA